MANIDLLAQLSETSTSTSVVTEKTGKSKFKTWLSIIFISVSTIAISAFAYVKDVNVEQVDSVDKNIYLKRTETNEVMPSLSELENDSTLDNVVLNSSGYVIATREATVAANATGRIVKVNYAVGDKVNKGDVIAEVDSEALKLQEAQAKSELNAKKISLKAFSAKYQQQSKDLAREKHLFERQMISEAKLAKLEHALAISKIELAKTKQDIISSEWALKIVQQRIANTKIRAPFSGIAVHIAAREGEIVSPLSGGAYTRSGICTLIDMTSLAIEVDVNENYLARIAKGQSVNVKLPSRPNKSYRGTVSNIIPTADKKTAAIKVRIVLDDIVPEILPQMTAQVDFNHT